MVVTGTPLINIQLAGFLIALSAICLILVAVMTIIDLVKKKGSGKGTKLSINWILLKLSAKQMLYILAFLVLLVLTISTSLFYTLRLPSLSSNATYPGKSSLPNITPSSTHATPVSTGTTPLPVATKQIIPNDTVISLITPTVTPKTPLPIPCSANCFSRLDVVLESVLFENSHNDLLFTFQISNKETTICNLAVIVLRIRGEHGMLYEGQGFGVSYLGPEQVLPVSTTFPLIPSPGFPYVFSLALSCQANVHMAYEEQTLVFDSYHVSRPQPNPPVAAPVIALINSILAFLNSPLGFISLIIFVYIFMPFVLWWEFESRPFGVLTSISEEEEIASITLRRKQSLARRLLGRSTISSKELVELARKEHFDLNGGEFDLVFKRGRQVYITRRGLPSIKLRRYEGRDIDVGRNQTVSLLDRDIISVEERDIAVFYISKKPVAFP